MAKRKTYEEKLLDNLMLLEPNKWFRIDLRPDYGEIVVSVKGFIDNYYPFTFSSDFKRLRRDENYGMIESTYRKIKSPPEGLKVVKIERGHREQCVVKGEVINLVHESTSYRVYFNDKLIAIET